MSKMACFSENSVLPQMPIIPDQRIVDGDASYKVDGKTFMVERVFNNDSDETVGTVLVKLLRMGAEE